MPKIARTHKNNIKLFNLDQSSNLGQLKFMTSAEPLKQSEIEPRIIYWAKTLEPYLKATLKADGNRLLEAMRYAVLGGGKRIRPFLVLETAQLIIGQEPLEDTLAYKAACAIEMVHCYSLIHDDLPAMDNDDMRRGLPTLHKAYDEATAILAGDALLTLAFEILTDCTPEAGLQLMLIKELAQASGVQGMVAGQMLDLAAEGRFEANKTSKSLNQADVIHLQNLKTGALIKCAVRMGAIIGGATPEQSKALDVYADNLGLAFQIADDLIDHEGDADTAGKATAKDADKGKVTFVSLFGAKGARQKLEITVQDAVESLDIFEDRATYMANLARHMIVRKS